MLPFTSNLPFTPNFSCFLAVDILLSITAFTGNFLTLVALHKESSLHPPSKLLHRCLATTDLLNAFLIKKKSLLLCIKELDELLVCLSAIFPSKKKTINIYPILKNVAIWKYILNTLYIYTYFIFSSQSVSLCWEKKRYIYLIYISKFERFLKTGI